MVDIGEQVVCQQHRLRALQMSVAGDDHLAVPFGQGQQRLLERDDALEVSDHRVPQVQLHVQRHLVVAAAAGVDLAAHRSHHLGEAAFHGHVDVLVTEVPGEVTGLQFGLHTVQTLEEDLDFRGRQDPDSPQHAYVSA